MHSVGDWQVTHICVSKIMILNALKLKSIRQWKDCLSVGLVQVRNWGDSLFDPQGFNRVIHTHAWPVGLSRYILLAC